MNGPDAAVIWRGPKKNGTLLCLCPVKTCCDTVTPVPALYGVGVFVIFCCVGFLN